MTLFRLNFITSFQLDELRGAGKTEESKLSSLSTSLTTDEAKTRLGEIYL